MASSYSANSEGRVDSRILPHDQDAEEAVIGSLLIGGEFQTANLNSDDFYYEANQFMFGVCRSLADRGVSINQVTVAQELHQQGRLESVGGASHLSHLISICPTSLDLPFYADIVRRLSTYRRMIALSDAIARLGYEAAPDLPASLSKADELLLELRKQNAQLTVIPPSERITRLASRYDDLVNIRGGIAIKTGLIDLDSELGGGLYGGDLIIVGGRPGLGKTAFMQGVANNISLTQNVLFCSAEMSIEALGDRDVAGLMGMKVQHVRLGGYDPDVYIQMLEKLSEMKKCQIFYCDDIPLTTPKIMQAAMATQLRYGLGLVVVDYLGLLADDEGENQVIRLGKMTRNLKALARQLNVPVLVAHQLNRALEQRQVKEKRPMLSDLRESGNIEQDADIVLMLYRDSYYKQLTDFERTFLAKYGDGEVDWEQHPESLNDFFVSEVIIRKHRQGESNVAVKVWFDRKHQKYCNLIKER